MDILSHQHREDRPWGSFEQFTLNEPTTVKILRVNPDQEFSLQKHHQRSEFWKVVAGSGTAFIGENEREVQVGDEIEIPVGTLHRLKGGPSGISVLEIAFGDFKEDDIERVADDYGRV
jgi:mannose-6-phosphate isomerase-like protein (cupin superfamily)